MAHTPLSQADSAALRQYGMLKSDAISKSVCLKCKQPMQEGCHSVIAFQQWKASGICGDCQDDLDPSGAFWR